MIINLITTDLQELLEVICKNRMETFDKSKKSKQTFPKKEMSVD
jgi:hypothetical protein